MINALSTDNRATTKTTSETDGSVLAVEEDEQKHAVFVAIVTVLQPMSEIPVLVTINASGIVQLDLYTPFGPQYPFMPALSFMDVF